MYCENPNIIIDKNLYRKLKYGSKLVYTDGKSIYSLNGRVPSPASVGATKDNFKDWNILTSDGELIPLYIQVPCGKCMLCREKRGREWSTRAACETATATYPPVFITLTYADGYLPYHGVDKDDVQKFLKRFRENWYRTYGERLNLRYFLASEYGTHFGRPHYHALLWNIPNKGENDILGIEAIYKIVARSWSEECSYKWYDSLPKKGYDFLQYTQMVSDGKKLYRKYYTLFGRIDVQADKGNSAMYTMKYMRKPKDVPINWTNPTFYLSSRRNGGIGVPYLNKHLENFRKTPNIIKMPVTLDYGTKVEEWSLPRVFRDRLFPSLSCLLPAYIRNSIERFETIYRQLVDKSFYGRKYGNSPSPIILQDENRHGILYHLRESLRQHYGRCYDFINHSSQMNGMSKLYPVAKGYISDREERIMYTELKFLYVQLYEYQPDPVKLERFLALKDKRQELLALMKIPDVDIADERAKILRRVNRGRIREVF